jgi:hypothetical protein
MTTTTKDRESFASLMARTQHLLDNDLGPRECDYCGSARSVGRRVGDPDFRCLPGYGCSTTTSKENGR